MTRASSVQPEKRPYAPRLPPEERREQLLDVARDLVAAHGGSTLSVDAVAKAAGVTRPVVYGQFEDVDAILEALLEREGERALTTLLDGMPTDLEVADPVETFVALAARFLEAVRADPACWRPILLPVEGFPPAVQEYKAHAEQLVIDRLAATMRHFRERDGGDAFDIDLIAALLVRVMEECGRLTLRLPEEYPADRVLETVRLVVQTFDARVSGGDTRSESGISDT